MLVRELFPELAKQIRDDLRRLKRDDLASQVANLSIVDWCRCGDLICGTFYTQGAEFRKRTDLGADMHMLDCGANLTEVNGMIVEVETLDPEVTRSLRQAIP